MGSLLNRLLRLSIPRFRQEREPGVFDALIREQVRSALESIAHTPGMIDVRVYRGQVTLSGRVHADDVQPLLDATRAIPGVSVVVDRLHLREPLHRQRPTRRWPLVALLLGAVAALQKPRKA